MIKLSKIVKIIFFVYIIILVYVLFFKSPYRFEQRKIIKMFSSAHFESCNFIPLNTIKSYIKVLMNHRMNIDIIIMNLLGNLLLFLPMGMFLPTIFNQTINKLWKFFIWMVVIIFSVEIIQFLTFSGSLDIDDFILNIIGAIFGFMIYKTCINVIKKGGNKDVYPNY